MAYDVFVSYSHAGDELVSERVQDGLVRFAKPWWRRRALKVFRDRSGLAANPGLWTAICEGIDESRYFLFLASPESAASPWCQREVDRWRSAHGADGIIVVLTAGTIAWDEAAGDFDWSRTDALVPVLGSCFREEPRWIDMRWARSELQLDLSDGRFSDQIAEIAAPIHGVAKDELIGSEVRQHRRTIRHAVIAAAALIVMTAASVTMAIYAVEAAASASRSAKRARIADAAELVQTKIARAATAAEKIKEQQAVALRARANDSAQAAGRANTSLQHLNGRLRLTINQRDVSNKNLNTAVHAVKLENGRLNTSNRALTSSELASTARLAARRGEQLLDAGDQTYRLGLLLTAESLRHSCASNAVKHPTAALATDPYPNSGCDSDLGVDPTVLASARLAIAGGAGRQFTVAELAGTAPVDPTALIGTDLSNGGFDPIAWSADARRFATLSTGETGGSATVEVWDRSGSPVASITSTTGLSSQAALSGDGNVLAVTANTRPGAGIVSVWSLVSGRRLLADTPGRGPSVSANGTVVVWLSDHGPHRVEIAAGGAATRAVGLPAPAAAVAVSPDGSVAVVLLAEGGNNYSLEAVATATGARGPVVRLPAISVATGDSWANPPRMFGSADPPLLALGDQGMVWVYNNERHVGVRLLASSHGPVLKLRTNRTIVDSETYLRAATPDGATVAAEYNDSAGHAIVTVGGPTANLSDIAALSLCASNACQFGLSPDGTLLLVRSLSILQLIDISKPATATTTLPLPHQQHAESVLMSPSGASAIRWDDRDLYTIDSTSRKQARVSLPLATREGIQSVDFSPDGASFAVLISHGGRCPCRVATVPALGTHPVADVQLRGPLPNAVDAASVALDDGADRVALAVGVSATATARERRCVLITFDATTGGQILERDNQQLSLGCESWSRPAFAPKSHDVAVVATGVGTANVAGVLLDADTGTTVHRLRLARGETTSTEGGSYGYALRFSPNGRFLAWNSGGGVVVWTNSERQLLVSQTVLQYSAAFDPNAVAVSDNGSVATVGKRIYSTTFVGNFDSLLTADALGRFFVPLGGASVVGDAADAQMSVAIDADGVISTATLDSGTSHIVIAQYNASPGAMLAALCTEASGTLPLEQWSLYFPDEPYHPACAGTTPAPPLQLYAGSPADAVEPRVSTTRVFAWRARVT